MVAEKSITEGGDSETFLQITGSQIVQIISEVNCFYVRAEANYTNSIPSA